SSDLVVWITRRCELELTTHGDAPSRDQRSRAGIGPLHVELPVADLDLQSHTSAFWEVDDVLLPRRGQDVRGAAPGSQIVPHIQSIEPRAADEPVQVRDVRPRAGGGTGRERRPQLLALRPATRALRELLREHRQTRLATPLEDRAIDVLVPLSESELEDEVVVPARLAVIEAGGAVDGARMPVGIDLLQILAEPVPDRRVRVVLVVFERETPQDLAVSTPPGDGVADQTLERFLGQGRRDSEDALGVVREEPEM